MATTTTFEAAELYIYRKITRFFGVALAEP